MKTLMPVHRFELLKLKELLGRDDVLSSSIQLLYQLLDGEAVEFQLQNAQGLSVSYLRGLSKGHHQKYQMQLRIPLQTEVEIECTVYHNRDLNAEVKGCLEFIPEQMQTELWLRIEIERRKQKLDELKSLTELQTSLGVITELCPAALFITDTIGQFTYVNNKWCEHAGLSFDEAINGQAYRAYHPDDRVPLLASWNQALEAKEDFSYSYRMLNARTGFITQIQCLARPIFNETKELIGYIGVNQDITELTRHAEQMENFIQNLPAGVAVLDRQMCYLYVSERFLKDYQLDSEGYTTQTIKGKNHYSVFRSIKEDWRQAHEDALKGFVTRKSDDNYFTPDGRCVWFDWEVRPWHEPDGSIGGLLMQTVDTTLHKNVESDLKMAREQALRATSAKSSFLAGMSHEMRTPLHSIIGYADMLQGSSLDKEQLTYVQSLSKSSDLLLGLINDVLDLSKIESGQLRIKNLPLRMKDVCEDIHHMFRLKCADKNLEFRYTVEEEDAVYLGDSTRISQILVNLLGNAYKFTEEGFIGLHLMRNHTGRKGNLHFLVEDTGVGIPRTQHGDIFSSFYQIDNLNRRKMEGTGLGLSITKQLVELMGGEIWVESIPGVGSRFHFTLDLQPVEVKYSINFASTQFDKDDYLDMRLLVVDDSAENRTLMRAFLAKTPFKVDYANDGDEALELMMEHHYNVVFMDIQMPRLNGQMATSLFREWEKSNRHEKTKIIALSACGLTEEISDAFKAGCDDYLVKPVKKDRILATLKEHIRKI